MKKSKVLRLVTATVWQVSPGYFFLLLFHSLSYIGQILANVIFPKFLIDELTGAQRPEELVLWVALVVGGNLFFTFLKRTAKRLSDVKEQTVLWEIERAFAEKIMSIEYRCLEDPYYLDLKERASFAMTNQSAVSNLVSNAVGFFNQFVTIIGLLSVMFTLSFVLVAVLTVMIGLVLLIQAVFAKYQQGFFQDLIPVNRRYGYYVGLVFQDSIHKDARIGGMMGMIRDTINRYNKEITCWFTKYHRKQGMFMGLFQVVVMLQTAFAYGYVATQSLNGLSIGSLTMYVSAAISFSSAVIALGTSVVTLGQMLAYLTPFAQLMAIPDEAESSGTRKLGTVESIDFENITFCYPKTDKVVLDNVSFSIHRGEKVSIVGLNGAGKSTVVKLLCGLYQPQSGRILLNGHPIAEYERKSFLEGIAAVFQDFKLFNFSIQENITCRPKGEDAQKVEALLQSVGLSEKIASLPHGAQTLLGKAYDEEGVELSGGQSQKIAIARALYKDASLVVLDEPTSALDPLAEAEIYEKFNELVGDKTAIYISHRMSSSVFCDKILVLNNGRIEAYGSHQKLMEDTDSLYYKLFTAQAENYRLEEQDN